MHLLTIFTVVQNLVEIKSQIPNQPPAANYQPPSFNIIMQSRSYQTQQRMPVRISKKSAAARRRRRRIRRLIVLAAAVGLCALLTLGAFAAYRAVSKRSVTTYHAVPADNRPKSTYAITTAVLEQEHVNEAGLVPILEYHEIDGNMGRMSRLPAQFRYDLERLYSEGYLPISLDEYLNNRIDLPSGKSPVVLTFDDARASQFRYLRDGSIDPDCAVGILQAFHAEHTDFAPKAVFFVLPEGAFGSSDAQARKKLRALHAMGYELQNHTLNHHYFNKMSDSAIVREIAQGKAVTEEMTPGATVDVLALPGGCFPRSHNDAILTAGEYRGIRYQNRAVMLAGDNPAPSPISLGFNPARVPRILAVEESDGITHWLDYLRDHPQERYVSDGDPNTVTVPRSLARLVDESKLHGATLRLYDSSAFSSLVASAELRKTAVHSRRSQRRHRPSHNLRPVLSARKQSAQKQLVRKQLVRKQLVRKQSEVD